MGAAWIVPIKGAWNRVQTAETVRAATHGEAGAAGPPRERLQSGRPLRHTEGPRMHADDAAGRMVKAERPR